MITTLLVYLFSLVLGYLFGSFPTGYFVGKFWNVDVRRHGSGRTGGTNVLRTVGWRAFALTVAGDIFKGILPVLILRGVYPDLHGSHALALLGVLLGNNWSILIALLAKPNPDAKYAPPPLGWIQWIVQNGRGGAGVMTTTGACIALFPLAALVLAPIGIGILVIIRYASVASLTVAVLYPIVMLVFAVRGDAPWSYFLVSLAVAALLIWVHRPNIERLRTGTEKRFGQRIAR